jgi:hypothetical protein
MDPPAEEFVVEDALQNDGFGGVMICFRANGVQIPVTIVYPEA